MVDVRSKECTHSGCTKRPSFGVAGTKTAEFCSRHAKDGMVDVLIKKCTHRQGCTKRLSYGVAGTKTAEFCSVHAKDGMVDVLSKKCTHRGCTKGSFYGVAGKTANFCSGHAKDGLVDVRSKKCTHRGCTKRPSYGVAGTKMAEFCSVHAKNGMVDVRSKKCTHRGCTTRPSYGVAGTKTAKFCFGHAKDGMVNVVSKTCTHRGCTTQPIYGMAGTKTAEFCSAHAKDGMVDIRNKKCTQRGCTTQPYFGLAGTKTAEFCSAHAKDWMVDVRNKKCTHRGCTTQPNYGVAGGTRTFSARHAEDGVMLASTSTVLYDAHSTSGCTRECADEGLDGSTARSAEAVQKRKYRFPSSTRAGTSAGRRRTDVKRIRQAPFHTSVTPAPVKTAGDERHALVEDCSISASDDASVKTEVAVSSKPNPRGALPVEAVAGESATPVEDVLGAEPESAVKTEVGIALPSKMRPLGVS